MAAPAGKQNTTYHDPDIPQSSSTSSGILDQQYYRGIPGLIKAVEAISSLIAYICIEVMYYYCGTFATYQFFEVITMFAFVTTLLLYLMLLFKLHKRLLRCGCIEGKWPILELGYYIGTSIFYFFGDLFLSIHGCSAVHRAAVFFGWVALAAYIVDIVYFIYVMRRDRNSAGNHTVNNAAPDRDTLSK